MKQIPPTRLAQILTPLLAILLLTGCFGNGDEDTNDNTPSPDANVEQIAFYRTIEASDFTMQVPEDWETIQQFTSNYPKNTVVAFRNNIKDHEFIANINVVRNTAPENTTTRDYALSFFETLSDQLIHFEKLSETEVPLLGGLPEETTFIYEFKGTNDPTQRTRTFIQTYGIKGTTAYIVTGTYSSNDTELAIDQVKQSVPTFMLK